MGKQWNQGWVYRDRIDATTQGWTVIDFYSQRYRHSDRVEWQQRIISGQILLDDQPTASNTQLQSGQLLTYHRPPWTEPSVPLTFTVLYEDDDLVVVSKPSGLPVLPGGGYLEHTLLWQLQQRYPDSPPVPIHRLGRGTSGLMLLARSPQARSGLSQQMRDRQIHKTYRTLVCGDEMPDRFSVTAAIGKIPYPTLGYLYAATPTGLPAQSDCQVIGRDSVSLLEVRILTGRPHQIRIHLAAAGYPLWGDPLYGVGGVPLPHLLTQKLPVPGDCGYHLHALHLQFTHPLSGQPLSIACPAPPELDRSTPASTLYPPTLDSTL
jgi:23S rRNA pseudouridine1911/1915/1917 synthase